MKFSVGVALVATINNVMAHRCKFSRGLLQNSVVANDEDGILFCGTYFYVKSRRTSKLSSRIFGNFAF
jgi:hypothetical protein